MWRHTIIKVAVIQCWLNISLYSKQNYSMLWFLIDDGCPILSTLQLMLKRYIVTLKSPGRNKEARQVSDHLEVHLQLFDPACRSARLVEWPSNMATIDCRFCCHKSQVKRSNKKSSLQNSWLTGKK
ncbi:hypothetical protein OS493_039818 [Desmophyllum pertusum]|uniref:Uncharacterized protein n=1 Tax=Desmophyllum pertusum TaxID=174260 RepID=A0A9W9ZUK2_9CNID|nr:hypothetical protein OS493_039818 [Desmophyllum pertusum]